MASICVQGISSSYDVEIDPGCTIAKLKFKIAKIKQVPYGYVHLISGTTELEDGRLLADELREHGAGKPLITLVFSAGDSLRVWAGDWYNACNWREEFDADCNCPYYYNVETGERVWTLEETGVPPPSAHNPPSVGTDLVHQQANAPNTSLAEGQGHRGAAAEPRPWQGRPCSKEGSGPAAGGKLCWLWRVVACCADPDGLVVRVDRSCGSRRRPQPLRLGSLVMQREVEGERLQYTLLAGAGPASGWVTTRLKGLRLLERVGLAPPPEECVWRQHLQREVCSEHTQPESPPEVAARTLSEALAGRPEAASDLLVNTLLRESHALAGSWVGGSAGIGRLATWRDGNGQTLLHLCVQAAAPVKQRQAAVKFLASVPSEVDVVDQRNIFGETPLMLAVRAAAVSYGWNETRCSESSARPPPWAALGSPAALLGVVRILLDAKADVDASDRPMLETPLMEAASAGSEQVCRLLLEYRADPKCAGFRGLTAADFAKGHPGVMRLLQPPLGGDGDSQEVS